LRRCYLLLQKNDEDSKCILQQEIEQDLVEQSPLSAGDLDTLETKLQCENELDSARLDKYIAPLSEEREILNNGTQTQEDGKYINNFEGECFTSCNNQCDSDLNQEGATSNDASEEEANLKLLPKNEEINNTELPKSDPTNIVLSRVRFLLHNPQFIPPYHILYSNSECMAVWCKTGRWSTLQASVFLHTSAAGNFKSAATVASYLAGQTVTTTVPASGIAGWFGYTTTATVSLFSAQPWIIPAIAGYGIVMVGWPILMLRHAREKWNDATTNLTDEFWGWADADIYVEAIRSWSKL